MRQRAPPLTVAVYVVPYFSGAESENVAVCVESS